jgi:hypothetical protein
MKNGFKAFDSDMHVYDAANLYDKYMNPKWGDRIPKGKRNGKHGRVEFSLGGGTKMRAITDVIDHGQKQVADRYAFAVARDYVTVSQLQGMDMEGLDVAYCFARHPCLVRACLIRHLPFANSLRFRERAFTNSALTSGNAANRHQCFQLAINVTVSLAGGSRSYANRGRQSLTWTA